MLRRIGLSSCLARDKASSPHGYQSTGYEHAVVNRGLIHESSDSSIGISFLSFPFSNIKISSYSISDYSVVSHDFSQEILNFFAFKTKHPELVDLRPALF